MKIAGNVSSKVIDGLNRVGSAVVDNTKRVKTLVLDKKDSFVKSETYKNIVSKANKNTLIGAGVVAVALGLAIKCVKEILDKTSEFKK